MVGVATAFCAVPTHLLQYRCTTGWMIGWVLQQVIPENTTSYNWGYNKINQNIQQIIVEDTTSYTRMYKKAIRQNRTSYTGKNNKLYRNIQKSLLENITSYAIN